MRLHAGGSSGVYPRGAISAALRQPGIPLVRNWVRACVSVRVTIPDYHIAGRPGGEKITRKVRIVRVYIPIFK
jgi:hypothetical protein